PVTAWEQYRSARASWPGDSARSSRTAIGSVPEGRSEVSRQGVQTYRPYKVCGSVSADARHGGDDQRLGNRPAVVAGAGQAADLDLLHLGLAGLRGRVPDRIHGHRRVRASAEGVLERAADCAVLRLKPNRDSDRPD